MTPTLKLKKLRESAAIPHNATAGSAGYDLCADTADVILIPAGETRMVPTGIAAEIPRGYAGFVFARSGLGIKQGIVPANCVGVIDSDYRGEIMVGLRNHSQNEFAVNAGDRIAQLVLMPVFTPEIEICDELTDTQRGQGGFGSTGK